MESHGSGNAPRSALVTYVHDFESTIQDCVSNEQQLIGILNFSALLHEDVYLNDIAIGDNPHLIRSFLHPPNRLYRTVSELIRNGVLFCHLRDKIVIRGTDLGTPSPFLGDIYRQWLIDGPPTRFITQIFDVPRDLYNASIDDLLNRFPNAVKRYDPDSVKPQFRATIRQLVSETNSDLRQLLQTLPREIEEAYLTTCEKNDYFTNFDLWKLYRNIPEAADLVVANGHISQQACADLVHAGTTGTRLSALEIERFDWKTHVGTNFVARVEPPTTFEEVLERADFVLSAPALEVLGLLTPDELMELRRAAEKTIFKIARDAPLDFGVEVIPTDFSALPTLLKPAIESFRKKYISALQGYWNHICEFVFRNYSQHTKVPVRSCYVPLERLSHLPAQLRTSLIGIALYYALHSWIPQEYFDSLWKELSAVGASGLMGLGIGELAGYLVLERPAMPAMKELRETDLSLSWKPRGLFATNRWK